MVGVKSGKSGAFLFSRRVPELLRWLAIRYKNSNLYCDSERRGSRWAIVFARPQLAPFPQWRLGQTLGFSLQIYEVFYKYENHHNECPEKKVDEEEIYLSTIHFID